MARYIDADKITYHKMSVCGGHGLNCEYTVAHKHEVDAIPNADVVEVVRCKDCAYANETREAGFVGCTFYRQLHKENDYCNYGEVRDV